MANSFCLLILILSQRIYRHLSTVDDGISACRMASFLRLCKAINTYHIASGTTSLIVYECYDPECC